MKKLLKHILLLLALIGCVLVYFSNQNPIMPLLLIVISAIGLYSIALSSKDNSEELEQKYSSTINQLEKNITENIDKITLLESKVKEAETLSKRSSDFIVKIQQSSSIEDLSETIINSVCKELECSQGVFFLHEKIENINYLKLKSSYAYHIAESKEVKFEFGEGLIGQAAKDKKVIHLKDIPEGHIEVTSGLGSSTKANLVIIPILKDNFCVGAIELASFTKFNKSDIQFLDALSKNLSAKIDSFTA